MEHKAEIMELMRDVQGRTMGGHFGVMMVCAENGEMAVLSNIPERQMAELLCLMLKHISEKVEGLTVMDFDGESFLGIPLQ